MIYSMTGFGRATVQEDSLSVNVEVKVLTQDFLIYLLSHPDYYLTKNWNSEI
jgi:uncharacterized protein YicC (UPF0701 family)